MKKQQQYGLLYRSFSLPPQYTIQHGQYLPALSLLERAEDPDNLRPDAPTLSSISENSSADIKTSLPFPCCFFLCLSYNKKESTEGKYKQQDLEINTISDNWLCAISIILKY
jgi:hypothetical protein